MCLGFLDDTSGIYIVTEDKYQILDDANGLLLSRRGIAKGYGILIINLNTLGAILVLVTALQYLLGNIQHQLSKRIFQLLSVAVGEEINKSLTMQHEGTDDFLLIATYVLLLVAQLPKE